jgi:glycosyltransferase involved in cell wall biosynthesis
VIFLDDVVETDLPALFSAATVYVQPSLYEGFGLPVLEALACGTVVVCANTSALPEVAGADTVVVDPTVEGLTSGIERALRAPRTAGARAARRAWAEKFSWTRTAEATVAAYERAQAGWQGRR